MGFSNYIKILIIFITPIFSLSQVCQYTQNSTDAIDLCQLLEGNKFSSDKNAETVLNRILLATGVSPTFEIMECDGVSNCAAITYKGQRYIIYNKDFMNLIGSGSSWSNFSILAHEIGHHVNGHTLDISVFENKVVPAPTNSERRRMEIEADKFSGFVMYKLGATLLEAQEAIKKMPINIDDNNSTHPSTTKRLKAIKSGWDEAKKQTEWVYINNTSVKTKNRKAEQYFYIGRNFHKQKSYQLAIDNYNKCIELTTDKRLKSAVCFQTANCYFDLKQYQLAIENFNNSLAIKLPLVEKSDSETYRAIANSYKALSKNELALENYNVAIELDNNNASAYFDKGNFERENLGKYYSAINSYTKSIKLRENSAQVYFNRGRVYFEIEEYAKAIQDFTNYLKFFTGTEEVYNLELIGLEHAYYNIGIAKIKLHQNPCNDFKDSCRLGYNNACIAYQKECKQ